MDDFLDCMEDWMEADAYSDYIAGWDFDDSDDYGEEE